MKGLLSAEVYSARSSHSHAETLAQLFPLNLQEPQRLRNHCTCSADVLAQKGLTCL